MATTYQTMIEALRLPHETALIEAVMRWEAPTLDHLSRRAFNGLARRAADTIPTLDAEMLTFARREAGLEPWPWEVPA